MQQRGAAPATGNAGRVTLVRWGAVFGGAVIALALMTLLTALWAAIGIGSGQGWVAHYMNWWVGASAIVCMFVGGVLAGWFAGLRGPGDGLVQGVTAWGLLLIAGLAIGLPGLTFVAVTSSVLWTVFWSLVIGLGVAIAGGIIGGALPQFGSVAESADRLSVRAPVPHEHRDGHIVVAVDREVLTSA